MLLRFENVLAKYAFWKIGSAALILMIYIYLNIVVVYYGFDSTGT